ncbi:MAG: TIGR01621 family pseudouridine synthase [Glaciecola sp.]
MIPIIFEHHDFIVVNKPIDLGMHGPEDSIIPLLKQQTGLAHLYLVHRLDTPTSGCLLIATNKQAASNLSQLFANRQIQKYYVALSDKKPKKKQGKISGDMTKARNGSYKLLVSQDNPATTFFFSALMPSNTEHQKPKQSYRLFIVKPITGKTHQIRVALKSLSSPILGDKRYKGEAADRLYLHSYSLVFNYHERNFDIRCLPQQGKHFVEHTLDQHPLMPPHKASWPAYQAPRLSPTTRPEET